MEPRTANSDARLRTRLGRGRECGYNLVALIVILVVINIAVAAAMPLWSTVVRRDKEEELLFRGLQYAEAIRVFQQRFNRYPVSLKELIEVEPRCIRQLWDDPLSESGAWQPILAGSGQARSGGQQQQLQQRQDDGVAGQVVAGGRAPGRAAAPRQPGGPEQQAEVEREGPSAFDESQPGEGGEVLGPLEGVRPSASGPSLKSFLDRTDYSDWEFRAAMLTVPTIGADGTLRLPRIGPGSITRPLPGAGSPAQGIPTSPRPTPDGAPDDN